MTAPGGEAAATAAIVRATARGGEPDRYLAALLAPVSARGDLMTLAAFLAEIGRIGEVISDPTIGEIRLQWWRDALDARLSGVASGNPVADAFADLAARRNFKPELLRAYFDAHADAFYSDPAPDEETLVLGLQAQEGMAFALGAEILGAPVGPQVADLVADAAVSYGLARLGLRLPYALARGGMPFPASLARQEQDGTHGPWSAAITYICREARMRLARVKQRFTDLPADLKVAFLPVALVEPYLRALEKPGHDAARDIGDVAPLVRVWKIGTAQIRGQL